MWFALPLCVFLGSWAITEVASSGPVVQVEQGKLLGRYVESNNKGKFWSFQGIPYAQPPVGDLRFKDAKPPLAWNGTRRALKEGQMCSQFNEDYKQYLGEEDCLFINVYTPQLPKPKLQLLPVMVFFHRGYFVFGNGNEDNYGADYLVYDGVVLVTMNYRLGAFGFLYLGEAAPGNAGLKDQVMALRWVQKNIAAFGGDPNKVTIFGHGAGGASVHMHMMSPMSKGLFHHAISQSGSSLNPWVMQHKAEKTTRRLGSAVGCTDNDKFALVKCLRRINYKVLVRAAREKAITDEDRKRLVTFTFVPIPETIVFPGVERFVTTSLSIVNDVPYITGYTSHEGLYLLAVNDSIFKGKDALKRLNDNWNETVLPELRIKFDNEDSIKLALGYLRHFFLGGKPLSQDTLPGYIDMFTDLEFAEGIVHTIDRRKESLKSPVYFYHFCVDDKLNFLKKKTGITLPGACHADDLGYLFQMKSLPKLSEDAPAAKARRNIVRLWTNFAKTGNPTPEDDKTLTVKWKPYTDKEKHYLHIEHKLLPLNKLNSKRYQFWGRFYYRCILRDYIYALPIS